MCLSDFERFEKIKKENALIGYRTWKTSIKGDSTVLMSENQNYNKILLKVKMNQFLKGGLFSIGFILYVIYFVKIIKLIVNY